MTFGVKRVKTGCITCRIRRVKCDEAHPECKKCLSTGRKCDGYSSLPFSRKDLSAAIRSSPYRHSPDPRLEDTTGLVLKLITDPSFSDVLEKRYFQYFRRRTVVSTNSLVAARFWDRTVLQTCHSVPAIKHAVLALSSWHQYTACKSEIHHRDYADKQYQLALENAQSLISTSSSKDVDQVLIACIVFICYEGVRGNYKACQLHTDNGRAIMKAHIGRLQSGQRRSDLVAIQQTMARLDLPAVCFSDASSPYHYTLRDFLNTSPILMPWDFKDTHEAQIVLFDLSRWMMVLGNHIDAAIEDGDVATLATLQVEKQTCSQRLLLWHEYFNRNRNVAEPANQLLELNLLQWYHGLMAMSIAESFGSELRWDAVHEHFEEIVRLSEEIVENLQQSEDEQCFSYELGYTVTVFLSATRCRDPLLRRRAIKILRAIPRQEGVWASLPAAAIAERWMQIEESDLSDVKSAADVPQGNRICRIDTAVNTAEQYANLVLTMPNDRRDALIRRAEVVHWE